MSKDRRGSSCQKTAEEYRKGLNGEKGFITYFKQYGNIDSLKRAMAVELIDEILVHEGG